jgi:hypothetical protein
VTAAGVAPYAVTGAALSLAATFVGLALRFAGAGAPPPVCAGHRGYAE